MDHGYFRVMVSGTHDHNSGLPTIAELTIKGNHQQYSIGFISLLQEYYLHL
jgi:hypothetical protein